MHEHALPEVGLLRTINSKVVTPYIADLTNKVKFMK